MMVGKNLKEQKHGPEIFLDEISGVSLEKDRPSLSEKERPTEKVGESPGVVKRTCKMSRNFGKTPAESAQKRECAIEVRDPGEEASTSTASSSTQFRSREKSPFKKSRRNNRCKYCRRLLGSPTSLLFTKGGKSFVPPPHHTFVSRVNTRRPLESPLDEMAWACGRIWCSVSRRKRRRKISENRQRKQINEAFSTLRDILPTAAQTEYEDSAAAKVSTLRLAASYIQALSDLLRDTHLSGSDHERHPKTGFDEEPSSHEEETDEKPSPSTSSKSRSSSQEPQFSKRGSHPPTKIPKNLFKSDKKISFVKSISGSETPLECV